MTTELPIIDVAPLRKLRALRHEPQSAEYLETLSVARETVGRQMFAALTGVGFFYITNHGIADEVLESTTTVFRRFFEELPLEEKMKVSLPVSGNACRGYCPMAHERTAGEVDFKESFYMGNDHPVDHPRVRAGTSFFGTNLFPDEAMPEMRPTAMRYLESMMELEYVLLEGISISLGLEPDYFRRTYLQDPILLMRTAYYPPTDTERWGVHEHADVSPLAILLQDSLGGLEVKRPDDTWMPVPPVPGTFVINGGDTLHTITEGLFRSAVHRARNPSSTVARITIPFFVELSWGLNRTFVEEVADKIAEEAANLELQYNSRVIGEVILPHEGETDRPIKEACARLKLAA